MKNRTTIRITENDVNNMIAEAAMRMISEFKATDIGDAYNKVDRIDRERTVGTSDVPNTDDSQYDDEDQML